MRIFFTALLATSAVAQAQSAQSMQSVPAVQAVQAVQAVRIQGPAPRIDGTPGAHVGSFELQNRDGARDQWGVEARADRSENGGWESSVEVGLSTRIGDRWELSLDPEWQRERDTRQYVATEGNGRPETYGNRYVFAAVDVTEISARIRANFTFTQPHARDLRRTLRRQRTISFLRRVAAPEGAGTAVLWHGRHDDRAQC